ncbi:MAG TPA: OsmC family protein [Nitrospirota bacterium]|nr:OsmC family protein [Nitrospirota bacterium]
MSDFAAATVRLVDGMQFVGESGTGHAFVMDAAEKVGGHNTGPRPMELLLIALGGCTGMDVVSILRKKKLEVRSLTMNVKGNWVAGESYPKYFETIELEYVVTGKGLTEDAVKRAAELSGEKYCSVMANLRGVSKVITSYKIINE